jgi:trans-aconitate 2-methyltransferase
MSDWNPALYMKFEDERARAARDLLAQIPILTAKLIYDLGCGPGNSTELLLRRFPQAKVIGVDTSDAMLAQARLRVPQASFVKQDIATWRPSQPPDVIFANAALHFLPNHDDLFPRLLASVADGGYFAAQMPNNLREASRTLMRMVAADGPWSQRLLPITKTRPFIASLQDYYAWLQPLSKQINLWMTSYVHPLDGPEGIVDWFAGSGLRPFLDPLDEAERADFLSRYCRQLTDSYPRQRDGKILLLYPRLSIVALRQTRSATP